MKKRGWKASPELRAKLSRLAKERANTPEHKERIRVMASQPKTEKQKEKMSLAKLGKPKSDAHRAAMSKAQRARWARVRGETQG